MAHIHREPYISLAEVTEDRALITWGAFFFEVDGDALDGRFKLIEDKDLKHVNPPRSNSIGETSSDYGPAEIWLWEEGGDPNSPRVARVPSDAPETRVNYVWIDNLRPNTTYNYRLMIKDQPWAEEERRDWVNLDKKQGLMLNKGFYQNRFTTHPRSTDPTPEFIFAVIGDYGFGVKERDNYQQKIAQALTEAIHTMGVRFVLTTGDHIYGSGLFHSSDTGNEDSDWFFTHYQPYRYILNQVPFYPTSGNHDTGETEKSDDYSQLLDNFYLRQRFFAGDAVKAEMIKANGLFFRFQFGKDVEFISIDSAKPDKSGDRAFTLPENRSVLEYLIPPMEAAQNVWRIPFFHHPPYVDGPTHTNDAAAIEHLVPLFEERGIRLVFNGHEHNFQISLKENIHYVLSGAGGDLRDGRLNGDGSSHNIAWAPRHHFLLVHYRNQRMYVTPYGELNNGQLEPISAKGPDGTPFAFPLEIRLN